MNANDIITRITDDLGLNASSMTAADWQRVLAGLEDGEALAALGITDDDQEAVEEAHSMAKDKRREALLDDAPGYPSQVYAGWVWMTDSTEHHWSKAATREGCEKAVEQAIDLHGVAGAFDLGAGE